ncbi:serine hydrolase, partial [Crocinitomix catalasitica]|nr:serine hydrolase [Crocinitomix catalasitica]
DIDLDEDINNYLPFAVDNPNFPADSITFRMLMTHTSSIVDNNPVLDTYYSVGDPTISLANVCQQYFDVGGSDYDPVNNFSTTAPSLIYAYSNIATALAGYCVEVVSGMPFDAYCNLNIFDVTCMYKTSWYLSDFDTMDVVRPYAWSGSTYVPYTHYGFGDYPDGQLRSNVTALANFVIAYLQGGTFNGGQLLSSASISEMLTPQVPSLDPTQGLNWYTEQIFLSGGGTIDLWGHNGGESGVSTDVYMNPANDIGIVVLSNGEGDNLFVVDELYDYALSLSTSGAGNPACAYTSLAEINENWMLETFPNPVTDNLNIRSTEPIHFIQITDLMGRIVLSETVSNLTTVMISLDGLESGAYLLKVDTRTAGVCKKILK